MRSLRAVPGVELLNFRQADGYLRVPVPVDKLTLPEGAMDFGEELSRRAR